MKKTVLLFYTLLVFSLNLQASHIAGGYISVRYVDSFDYVLELILYHDQAGISPPSSGIINLYQRDSIHTGGSGITLPMVYSGAVNALLPHCNPSNPYIFETIYRDTVSFNHLYRNASGYLLTWTSCCRNSGVVNTNANLTNGQYAIITMVPPFADSLGNPNPNSTPVLNTPIADRACVMNDYRKNFGGYDIDGDSIDHVLYSPFTGQVSGGLPSPLTSPHIDPSTFFGGVPLAPTYSVNDLIHGYPPPNPSPNRLKLDLQTGDLSVKPIGPIGYYSYGIWTREYRNGTLIGSVFRELQMTVENCGIIQNNPPLLTIPQNQALASWNGDTLEFQSNPICIQMSVTDADSAGVIMMEAVHSDYDSSDLYFLQDSVYMTASNTFNTALCFDPDSFLQGPAYCEVIARNPDCFDLMSDTAKFWFRFVNYSNAGLGGSFTYHIGQVPLSIDLINLLSGDPNTDGTWYDLDNSGWLNAMGVFQSRYINGPVSYRFMYVDNKPNYSPDTALLTLNFVTPTNLEELAVEDVLIYPNPSSGQFTFKVPQVYIGSSAEIFSYDLKRIRYFRIEESESSFQIDRPGLYFFRVERQVIKKVIIEN